MKISLVTYSLAGCLTAKKLIGLLPEEEIAPFCARRLEGPETEGFSRIPVDFRTFYGERFGASDALIFVGACGIAVREIAPFVKSKKTDPAVIDIDDSGRFVIPVLSGHIGGANALAKHLAELMDAIPVITTATDINGRFSVDTWATQQGFVIGSMKAAKLISAVILERDIPLATGLPVKGDMPPGVYRFGTGSLCEKTEKMTEDPPHVGIYIGWDNQKPFRDTLVLIPKTVHLGIGCRRGTSCEKIKKAVNAFIFNNGIDRRAVKCAASIDLKKDEEGLLAWSEQEGIPIAFYSAEELSEVQGEFTPSEFVASVTGVDNVCERAALIGAGELVVRKNAADGVTVAAAVEYTEVCFE